MCNTQSTILVVDDSTLSRKKVCLGLQDSYNIIQAKNGKEALELIPKHKPQFVFCDLLMPEMDGFEFLSHVSKQFPHIPCTIITADIQKETHDECKRLGAVSILKKPAKKEKLLEAIDLMTKAYSK
ncbi:MAG: response regulator [Candidatus Cloacimonetes bacterium]|nr:response regulator [Candidatus Cloacimonadota bacterium]